jgi:hypothetical protein
MQMLSKAYPAVRFLIVMVWFLDHDSRIVELEDICLNFCELFGHGAVLHTYFQSLVTIWKRDNN